MVLVFRDTDGGGAGVADPRRHPYYTKPVTEPTNFSTNSVTSNSLNLAFNSSYKETRYTVSTSIGGPSVGSDFGNSVGISGLSPGTAYVFYVTAQSLRTFYYGGMPYYTNNSTTVLSTTSFTTAPSAVTITSVTMGSNNATVAFTSTNGQATTYTITSSPASSTLTAAAGSSASVYFTGLAANTSYTFTVTANSTGGSTPVTSSSYATVGPSGTIGTGFNAYYPLSSNISDYSTGTAVSNLNSSTTFPNSTATISTASPYSSGVGYLNIAAGGAEFYLYRNFTFSAPISISCWFKINYTDYSSRSKSLQYVRLINSGKVTIWFVDNGSNNAGLLFVTYVNGEIGGQTYRTITTSGNIANNAWHHFVLTISSTFVATVYIDNVVGLTFSFSTTPTNLNSSSGLMNTTTGMTLLRNPGDGQFYYWGSFGGFRFYNKQLSTDEITYIYNNKV